jgi:hypothetical protein
MEGKKMNEKGKLPTICPSCDGKLLIGELSCESCNTKVSGTFEMPAIMKLSKDEMEFAMNFIKSSGSLKTMASQMSLSYPSVRNILDEVIEKLSKAEPPNP